MKAPTLSSEHRPLPLAVTTGVHGYRIAFVGGGTFEPVDDPHDVGVKGTAMARPLYWTSPYAAREAQSAAKAALGMLDRICRQSKRDA